MFDGAVRVMHSYGTRTKDAAAPLGSGKPTLDRLRDAAATCRACDLYKTGTQTVLGEGVKKAEVMVVGEQPG